MDTAELPFGKFVRKVRKDRDMTQEELAVYLGVTRDQIASIETGKTSGVRGFRALFYERMGISEKQWESMPPKAAAYPLEEAGRTGLPSGLSAPPTPRSAAGPVLLDEIKAAHKELGCPLLEIELAAWSAAKKEELVAESALLREALELRTKRELLAAAKASRQRWEAKAHGK